MSNYLDYQSLAMQITSSLSAAGAMTMMITHLTFPKIRKKNYYEMLFYVAVSNLLTSIGSALGICATGTFECWFQGFATNIFTLTSIAWTMVISYSLYSIMIFEKPITLNKWYHLASWSIPVLATVLPLINMTYGNFGNWCWVITTSRSPFWAETFWFWMSFYTWVWLGIFVISYFLIASALKSRNSVTNKSKEALQKIITKLKYYPFIIFISWGPTTIADSLASIDPASYSLDFGFVTAVLACSQGLLTAIVFWWTNPEAVDLWKKLSRGNAQVLDEKTRSEVTVTTFTMSSALPHARNQLDEKEQTKHVQALEVIEESDARDSAKHAEQNNTDANTDAKTQEIVDLPPQSEKYQSNSVKEFREIPV